MNQGSQIDWFEQLRWMGIANMMILGYLTPSQGIRYHCHIGILYLWVEAHLVD